MSAGGGAKAVVAALLANIGIAVLKFLAWGLTGASSMLAEAIHSVADSGNQMLLLLGRNRSRRAATREHQFGYGRERYVYAFLVSVVLFSVGGLFALYEAYHKLQEVLGGHPDELLESSWWWVPLVVLGGALVLEGLSFRTAVIESASQRGTTSWVGFVRGTKSPELPVVLLEDSAALVGLCFALLGVGLSKLTGSGYWDVGGTAAIGLLLVAVAVVLAVETKSLLLGESARPEVERRIREALEATPGVERVIHIRTLHLGPDELLVAAKTGVPREASAAEVARGIDAAERAIRSAEPMATLIYIEPDIDRGEQGGSG
ncbi:MAG TPA: cation diffusion facilitator family transporter [Nocardioidaceae bacterium]|nr:cation diffusion facilitator family transporter [Nocardioidaceae bacterium]